MNQAFNGVENCVIYSRQLRIKIIHKKFYQGNFLPSVVNTLIIITMSTLMLLLLLDTTTNERGTGRIKKYFIEF